MVGIIGLDVSDEVKDGRYIPHPWSLFAERAMHRPILWDDSSRSEQSRRISRCTHASASKAVKRS